MDLLITCLNATQKRFFVDTSLDTKLKKPFKTGCLYWKPAWKPTKKNALKTRFLLVTTLVTKVLF